MRIGMDRGIGLLALVAALTCAAPAAAQAPAAAPKLGVSNSTDLGLVIATGNSRSTSVGLRNVYLYRWSNAELRWEGGWLRVASRDGDRYAVGTPANFDVVEPGTSLDSQRLFSKLRYQHQLSPRTDWFGNFDAVRDEPANLLREFVLAGGLGTTWRKTDRAVFRTAYGVTYTDEDLAVEGDNRFAGYRLYYGLKAPVAKSSTFESELTTDGSFDTANDIRSDWLNSVGVSINSKLALKTSVRVLFRNLPALQILRLQSPAANPVGTVEVPKDQVDTNITTSLVITF
jgi:putative salt-induced outer membrane protein YdiY